MPIDAHHHVHGHVFRQHCHFARDVTSLRGQMVSGSVAAALTVIAVTPLDVVKVRLQTAVACSGNTSVSMNTGSVKGVVASTTRGVSAWQTARQIVVDRGVRGLWLGSGPALAQTIPATVLYLTAYEYLRSAWVRLCTQRGSQQSPPRAGAGASRDVAVGGPPLVRLEATVLRENLAPLAAGFASRAFASAVTAPIEFAAVQIQSGEATGVRDLLARRDIGSSRPDLE